ncbi:MAG: hypothetical protein FWF76_06050 [Oscillospiraceae bacterium]|nr:hypothetical protein [Oscillospiraceae bacterium]
MKNFFHCDANMYRKKVRAFFEYTAAPAVFVAIFLTICLLLSLHNLMNSGLLFPAILVVGGIIFVFSLITRILIEITEYCIRVHSRYTYIEIGLKDVIVSLYAGSYAHFGQKNVFRKIIVIPLETFVSAEILENSRKNSRKNQRILIKLKNSKIRVYSGKSERLGYNFREGDFRFNEFYYQEGHDFKSMSEIIIPGKFGSAKTIVASIRAAKERFEVLPPENPYIFKELAFVKARKVEEKSRRLRDF